MDEARRFLRYVTPGLTFAVQALLLLFIVDPVWTLKRIAELKTDTGAGLAVALFLASGGLGYLFSVVHHTLHRFPPRWLSAVDHTKVVEQLSQKEFLELKKLDGTKIDKIDRQTAWVVVTAVWKENLKNGCPIQSADAYASALMDVVHSAGSARVGALLALAALVSVVFWPLPGFCGPNPSCESRFAAIFVGLGLVVLHHLNYLCAGKQAERFINEVLADALSRKNKTATFVDP